MKNVFMDDFSKYSHSSYNAVISDKATKLKREDVLGLFEGKVNFIEAHNQK